MPNASNIEMLSHIKEDLDGVGAVWVVDYRGLSVKESEALRRSIRQSDSIMKVYKNNLVRIALSELDMVNIDDILSGPSAFVFSGEDVASSAKAIKEFAKENENLVIKGGIMDGAFVDAAQIEAIASLPSREQLMGQIAGALSSIARGLAVTINGVPSGVARGINAVSQQKDAA